MSLTLKQLKVFRALALSENMARAAEIVFVTKPALSMALHELENQLGQPLFDRVNNRLRLNSQGKRLLPLADELLLRAEHLEQSFKRETILGGVLNIGASNTIGDYLLPSLLGEFLRQYPGCQPTISVANTQVLANQLNHFELDMILVEGSLNDPRLELTPWLIDEMILVVAPDHPLSLLNQRQGRLSVADLSDQFWILREPGSGTREQFDRSIAPQIGQWNLRLESPRSEVILGTCRAGLGIAYVSSIVARQSLQEGTLCPLSISLDTHRQLHLVVQKDKYRSPLLHCFMQFCQDWSTSAQGLALAS